MTYVLDKETAITRKGNHYVAIDKITKRVLCSIATVICKGTRCSLSPYYWALLEVQKERNLA